MKILNVQLKHVHGGNPQVCLNYTQLLRCSGNEVVTLLNPAEIFIKEHQAAGAEVVIAKRLGNMGPYDILTILYFKKIIAQIKPDIIITHEGRSSALMQRSAGNRIPVIDVNHGRSPKQSIKSRATIVVNKPQFNATRALVHSDHLIYSLPNSIDFSNHIPPQFPKTWHEIPVIGTIGRLVKDKGIDVFLDAIDILNKRGSKFKVIIAGEGEERQYLEQKTTQLNLNDIVTMPGWIKNPQEFYTKIDIFCFPSRKEEFGLVLLEAWKNGLPVVVSDADGPTEIVTPGVDAIVISRDNAFELANGLARFLSDKAMADKMAIAGYNKLLEKYDNIVVAKQLNGILEEVSRKFAIIPNKINSLHIT